jgi:hypothetical protein
MTPALPASSAGRGILLTEGISAARPPFFTGSGPNMISGLAGAGHEFDCSECGRHIVRLSPGRPEFGLCALCIDVPGWHDIPELRERLDPDLRRG